jgi:glycosyltransferase involved in cell wall biosynthesis
MLRVGLIAPCIGVGGGDALMLGLVRYCHNIKFTGVFVGNPIEKKHYDWTRKADGNLVPIHARINDPDMIVEGVNYHETHTSAIMAAVKDADIVMMWCVPTVDRHLTALTDVPLIDYIQNSDKYAKDVVNSNLDVVDFHAACSRTAAKIMPPGKQCTVIYNGVDPGRVTPRAGRDRTRKSWGLADRKIALYMGRHVKEKHPEALLGALTYLPEEWVVLYVGEGYQSNDLYNQAQLMHPGRVFWVDSQYHVGDILAATDVFVLPSDFEGHSLALNEAWLAGTPTVYTDFDTMQELESMFGQLGVKVPRLCPNTVLADAILQADMEPNPSVPLAQSVVWNNFTLPTIAWLWEEYFHECVQVYRKQKRMPTAHITAPRIPLTESR